jgi:1-deoxy-D-xylulose-5-phosphate reductoisomerase
MKNITLLGATGSIGSSTLSVIDRHPDMFNVFAISANTNWQLMLELCKKYEPRFAVMADTNSALKLESSLDNDTEVLGGNAALSEIASHNQTDYVMAAIVGAAGMSSALAAANAGKRVMLANKESLVMAGDIFIKAIKGSGAELIPVDSEHSAIFQCMQGDLSSIKGSAIDANNAVSPVSKIQLTASGGPFLNTPAEDMKSITPEQACKHPNWRMGRKISVDSATMMNKGLEVIEAHYLFSLLPTQIDVIVHPQSIVHSSVYYKDGSVLSQLGIPDMRTAVSYAMSYPYRITSGVEHIDLTQQELDFFEPDLSRFPCLGLAFESLNMGSSYMVSINAANEVAVDAFLNNTIKFLDISKIIEQTLAKVSASKLDTLEDVVKKDLCAREIAIDTINHYA